MPTPQQVVAAIEFAEELAPKLARGSEGLNFLSIASRGSTVASGLQKAETVAALGQRMAPMIEAASVGEKFLPALDATLGARSVAGRIAETGYLMENRYAAVHVPSIVLRGRFPAIQPLTFDTADDLGRIWSAGRSPLAAVAKMPVSAVEPVNFGSGFAVRSDGLLVAARHTVRDGPAGDIWVRFPNQPGTSSFRAGIFAESKADDLVLLKPLSPLGVPVSHIPLSAFTDAVAPRSKLVTIGIQNHNITTAGTLTGDLHMSQGALIDKVPVRFPGEAATERLRSTIVGEYGMSGGATYELRSGKVVGGMLGGNDYSWSGLAPSGNIRALIARNFHRP